MNIDEAITDLSIQLEVKHQLGKDHQANALQRLVQNGISVFISIRGDYAVKPRFINGCAKSISLVREFEAKGWDAWTCDILPSEGWNKHIQDDILKHLNDGWDFGIFHQDCTYLANSGVRWRVERQEWQEIREAADFFNAVNAAPFPHVSENPIQHKYAREYIPIYSQIIQPWNFGVLESKAICLWLTDTPKLILPIAQKPDGVKQSVWCEAPSADRKANRARNFPAISKAMAEQWGDICTY